MASLQGAFLFCAILKKICIYENFVARLKCDNRWSDPTKFLKHDKAQAIRCKSGLFRFSDGCRSDLSAYLKFLTMRQPKNETNCKALEALLDTLKPQEVSETLQTIFLDYITADDFCDRQWHERQTIVHSVTQIINFFNKLGGIK